VHAGAELQTTAEVLNGGNVAANVVIEYYLSPDQVLDTLGAGADVLLGTSNPATALNGGQATIPANRSLTIPATPPPGNYFLLLQLDPSQAVTESNEANNMAHVKITVAPEPLPDLTFANISATIMQNGKAINLSMSLRNVGSASAEESTAGFFLSSDRTYDAADLLVTNHFLPAIQAGASAGLGISFSIPADFPSGNHYILFVADYHNLLTEANKANNVKSVAVVIPSPGSIPQLPDLVITNTVIANKTGPIILKVAGDTLDVSFQVVNIGVASAGASQVAWYLSKRPIVDASTIFLVRLLSIPWPKEMNRSIL
jgi:subtilase family serine protease